MPDHGQRDHKKKVPKNQRLWDMIVARARQKYRVYPSQAAARWVHDQYVSHGGQFVESEKDQSKSSKDDAKGDAKGDGRKKRMKFRRAGHAK